MTNYFFIIVAAADRFIHILLVVEQGLPRKFTFEKRHLKHSTNFECAENVQSSNIECQRKGCGVPFLRWIKEGGGSVVIPRWAP